MAFLALTEARDAFDRQQVVMACIAAVILVFVTVDALPRRWPVKLTRHPLVACT